MRYRKGYTVLEVMVAIVILAIALPGLATMVITARKGQVGNERLESSAAYGQAVLDSLLLLPQGRIPEEGQAVQTVNGTDYVVAWKKTLDAKSTSRIRLTVNWVVGGKNHSTVLQGVAP